jgi:hypothetical protein
MFAGVWACRPSEIKRQDAVLTTCRSILPQRWTAPSRMCFCTGRTFRAGAAILFQDRDGELPAGRIGNMGELVACGEEAQPDHTGKEIAAEDGAGGEQDIAVVLDQVAALRSEIDRLIGLVDSAVRKLED